MNAIGGIAVRIIRCPARWRAMACSRCLASLENGDAHISLAYLPPDVSAERINAAEKAAQTALQQQQNNMRGSCKLNGVHSKPDYQLLDVLVRTSLHSALCAIVNAIHCSIRRTAIAPLSQRQRPAFHVSVRSAPSACLVGSPPRIAADHHES